MSQQPWSTGPSEILQHGLSLLHKDSDSNRRLAMLSIDNAVELTIKTYLSLPRRISGINLPRKEFQEISESFPQLLDTLEKYSADKLNGIDLGEIEWFHRLRNQLYHQGNGLTIDREKIEIYSELAKLLFYNLFGFHVEPNEENSHELLGKFLALWVEIERTQAELINLNLDKLEKLPRSGPAFMKPNYGPIDLAKIGLLSLDTVKIINELRDFRNKLVHGDEDFRKVLGIDTISKARTLVEELKKAI